MKWDTGDKTLPYHPTDLFTDMVQGIDGRIRRAYEKSEMGGEMRYRWQKFKLKLKKTHHIGSPNN